MLSGLSADFEVHPRVSGVLPSGMAAKSFMMGSSPRERGFVAEAFAFIESKGFIPA